MNFKKLNHKDFQLLTFGKKDDGSNNLGVLLTTHHINSHLVNVNP